MSKNLELFPGVHDDKVHIENSNKSPLQLRMDQLKIIGKRIESSNEAYNISIHNLKNQKTALTRNKIRLDKRY
jgi:hypothetical protein